MQVSARPAHIRQDDGYTRLRSIRMTSTMMMMTTIVPMPMYMSGSSFASLLGVMRAGEDAPLAHGQSLVTS
jgi:hypothetical protein